MVREVEKQICEITSQIYVNHRQTTGWTLQIEDIASRQSLLEK